MRRVHPVTFCCDFVSGSRNCVRSPSAGRQVRLRRPDLIAKAAKSMDAFDLVSKERVDSLRSAGGKGSGNGSMGTGHGVRGTGYTGYGARRRRRRRLRRQGRWRWRRRGGGCGCGCGSGGDGEGSGSGGGVGGVGGSGGFHGGWGWRWRRQRRRGRRRRRRRSWRRRRGVGGGNGGGGLAARVLSARPKPRCRRGVPPCRGDPTRGIEPRTPTAGCCLGGPPPGEKRAVPVPGRPTPWAAGASCGRAGSPEKVAKRRREAGGLHF